MGYLKRLCLLIYVLCIILPTVPRAVLGAKQTVHVTSEANTRPIITALTMMSADRNIDHGDRSCTDGRVDFSERPLPSVVPSVASVEAGGAVAAG